MGFSVTVVLLSNGVELTRHTEAQEDYIVNTELQLAFPNVNYSGELQFQVFASNYLGDSDLSPPSLPGLFLQLHCQ